MDAFIGLGLMESGSKRSLVERNKSPALVESKEQPSEEFVDVCKKLDPDIDPELLDKAWKQFDTVGQQYVLEGSNLAWMACSIYLSMWQSTPIGQDLRYRYPVSKLNRICKISVLEFFDKLSKWVVMAGGARRMQEQVSRIQSSLAVSTVVYKKLLPIFRRVFAPPSEDHTEAPIDCKKVFELVWTLFIAMKKQLITDDLMNSFHLLLCAVDFVFRDLRNSEFQHLLNADFVNLIRPEEQSALETLCRTFEDVLLDAKHFHTHWWMPRIRTMINEGKILADSEMMNLIANVEINLNNLNELYEEAMMKKGEMDERMFIPTDIITVFDDAFDASAVEQLRRSAVDESWAVDAELLLRMSTQSCLERLSEHRQQQTPLSGKSYVISGEQFCPATPISGSLYNATKMEHLLADEWHMPSEDLERIMSQCRENPKGFKHVGHHRQEQEYRDEECDRGGIFFDAADIRKMKASAVEQLRRSAVDESWAVDAELLLRMSTQSCLERLSEHRQQQTPLSGKSYVISGEQFCPATPISGSLYNATKMEHLLADEWHMPSEDLERIMSQCRENPKVFIVDCLRLLGDKLENAVAAERESRGADFDTAFSETISLRRGNADRLFYRLLEKVVVAERERVPANESHDLSVVLNKEELISSIYVCALELILFTYESEREFPWSLEVVRLAPIHFYKAIELVIRAEPELSREMVKHLNKIEERVLEELAWSVDSPLWQTLARRADGVPSSQSVSLNSMEAYSVRTHNTYGLSQRYSFSPVKVPTAAAKRRLEFDDDGITPAKRVAVDPEWNASTSATILFFRKVYYLAAVRLQDLCERVHLDEKGRHRVWTLFEHVLRTETSLMAGRHLDQNLMCCLYVVAKISKQDVSFHNIMYHYRHQPQASSRVYRQVLIDHTPSPTVLSDDNASRDSVGSNSGGKLRSGSTLPIPGMGSAPPTPEPQNVDYTDLIKYYNRMFVSRVEYFVKKLQPGLIDLKESGISLLAMPTVRCHTLSPRRTIAEHVSVLPMPVMPASPARPIRYSFNRSPTKELRTINTMVNSAGRPVPYAIGSYPSSLYRTSPYAARTFT
ncbi:Retinoblastoma-like protein 2 [Toxocara canis]|uniref:Retinoblastoma-like protein 2 n=1 Tax=Toxocara canis TaxID=6265 RepID=A0A0B2VRH3_TOXCA|nr:Retinoblastoma-like protein 2 [Toxocara canis]